MNDSIYTRLGVRPIINAYAPMTRVGGGVMSREVADAMREAKQSCVDIAELLMRQLRKGTPGIEVNPWKPEQGMLILSPACLGEDDPFVIGRRFKERLS